MRYIAIVPRSANVAQKDIEDAFTKIGVTGAVIRVDSDRPMDIVPLSEIPKFWAFSGTIGLGWRYVGLILWAAYVLSKVIGVK